MSRHPVTPPVRYLWTDQTIHDFWDRVARTRLTELSFAKSAASDILALIAPYLRKDGTHLDFGGGDGDMAEALIRAGYPTAVFEPSIERCNRMSVRLRELEGFLGVDNGDGTASYDVVLCLEVIEHIPESELQSFIYRLSQSVSPGGTLILSCPNAEDLDMDSCLCPNCGAYFHRWQHLRSVTPQWLQSLLKSAGFERLWMGFVGFDPKAVTEWVASRLPSRPSVRKRLFRFLRRTDPQSARAHDLLPDATIGNGNRIVFVGRRHP